MAAIISKSRSRKSRERNPSSFELRKLFNRSRVQTGVIFLFLWVGVTLLMLGRKIPQSASLASGQRAPVTISAAIDFTCTDITQTRLAQEKAAQAIPPVFSPNQDLLEKNERRLRKMVEKLQNLRSQEPPPAAAQRDQQLDEILYLLELPLKSEQVQKLFPPGHEQQVLSEYLEALAAVWRQGILSPREKTTGFEGIAPAGKILLLSGEDAAPIPMTTDEVRQPKIAARYILEKFRPDDEELTLPMQTAITLSEALLEPNLLYQPLETEKLRLAAMKNVQPVEMRIAEGTILMERGKLLSAPAIEQIKAHEQKLLELEKPRDRQLRMLGTVGMLGAFILLCGSLLFFVAPETRETRLLLITATVSLLTVILCKALFRWAAHSSTLPQGVAEFMLPVGLAGVVTSILVSRKAGLAAGIWTSLTCALVLNQEFQMFGYNLTAALVGASVTVKVQRRSSLLTDGLWIGAALLGFTLLLGALNRPTPLLLGHQCTVAVANGILTALFALVLLPLLEFPFRVTTDITLLEFSDLGHPLLQRLAKEAPGTYHHSLMVADLARAAAESIGANGLLVRVCAYYHDVGKLTKPEFFAENQPFDCNNPHDDLAPSMSTLVILSHVKEGLSLAARYKLPDVIRAGIQQHHGTSVISYFYHRAKRQRGSGADVPSLPLSESDFRYPGPKPATREMAILHLADSIEAASRCMQKPTHAKIEGLITEIIESRLEDGQLDECNLTFQELHAIRQSFVFSMSSMLHARIEYPQNENPTYQSTEVRKDPAGQAESLDPLALEEGRRG